MGSFQRWGLGVVDVLPAATNRLLADTYYMDQPTTMTDLGGDNELTARRTIEYLTYHNPRISVSFLADPPPSEQMLRLLEPYLVNIEVEVGETVARYMIQSLAKDHLEMNWLGVIEDGS